MRGTSSEGTKCATAFQPELKHLAPDLHAPRYNSGLDIFMTVRAQYSSIYLFSIQKRRTSTLLRETSISRRADESCLQLSISDGGDYSKMHNVLTESKILH